MTDSQLYEVLQIRYIKLHFTIIFTETAALPVYKVSALRGGIGEMLLQANCIRDRRCNACDFESECIVRRTMYSKFEEKPAYITNGESAGYVLECENYMTDFPRGEKMDFNLLLFGKSIVYFNLYLQAVSTLGRNGLGKEHAKFQIAALSNTQKQDILKGNQIFMRNYIIQHISDYVDYRLEKLQKTGIRGKLVFKTPLTLKVQGEFLQEFHLGAIINAVKRRIEILNYFEGRPNHFSTDYEVTVPEILEQEHRFVIVNRYSSRQDGHMSLKGIEGSLQMEEVFSDALPLLLAGELIHIGKNTSFGFGRYQVK